MSNCLAYNTLIYKKESINQSPIICPIEEVKLGDYVMNVNKEFQKVCKIEYFEKINCIDLICDDKLSQLLSIIFSKDHFSEINFKKLEKLNLLGKQVISDVVGFYCENNQHIEVVPYFLNNLFA